MNIIKELMEHGGFPMWFILAFGVIALAASARYAIVPHLQRTGFIYAMGAATLFTSLMGVCTDLSAVFVHVSERDEWRNDPQWMFIVMRGLAESLIPAMVGFTFLALVALLVAVGRTREAPAA